MERNILTWNKRGFNKPSRVRDALRLIREQKNGLLGLLEIKVQRPNFNRVSKGLKGQCWNWEDNYSSDSSGRIIIGWDHNAYSVSKILEMKQVVHLRVRKLAKNFSFLWLVVHASNCPNKRQQLWDNLVVYTPISKAWMVSGDLNNVIYLYGRRGEDAMNLRETLPFADSLSVTRLVALKASGYFQQKW